jgi:hypothetical protein
MALKRGSTTDEMKWAIEREIDDQFNLKDKTARVLITCEMHESGRPGDMFADPRMHCTFKDFEADGSFINTYHAYPSSEIPPRRALASKNWWEEDSKPAASQARYKTRTRGRTPNLMSDFKQEPNAKPAGRAMDSENWWAE